ncbi:MAG: hypothetical protein H6739_34750 [Alphaproteobacteria bacterium]|nr:hypothetical protein [Alphaproteobacteria bacterium]
MQDLGRLLARCFDAAGLVTWLREGARTNELALYVAEDDPDLFRSVAEALARRDLVDEALLDHLEARCPAQRDAIARFRAGEAPLEEPDALADLLSALPDADGELGDLGLGRLRPWARYGWPAVVQAATPAERAALIARACPAVEALDEDGLLTLVGVALAAAPLTRAQWRWLAAEAGVAMPRPAPHLAPWVAALVRSASVQAPSPQRPAGALGVLLHLAAGSVGPEGAPLRLVPLADAWGARMAVVNARVVQEKAAAEGDHAAAARALAGFDDADAVDITEDLIPQDDRVALALLDEAWARTLGRRVFELIGAYALARRARSLNPALAEEGATLEAELRQMVQEARLGRWGARAYFGAWVLSLAKHLHLLGGAVALLAKALAFVLRPAVLVAFFTLVGGGGLVQVVSNAAHREARVGETIERLLGLEEADGAAPTTVGPMPAPRVARALLPSPPKRDPAEGTLPRSAPSEAAETLSDVTLMAGAGALDLDAPLPALEQDAYTEEDVERLREIAELELPEAEDARQVLAWLETEGVTAVEVDGTRVGLGVEGAEDRRGNAVFGMHRAQQRAPLWSPDGQWLGVASVEGLRARTWLLMSDAAGVDAAISEMKAPGAASSFGAHGATAELVEWCVQPSLMGILEGRGSDTQRLYYFVPGRGAPNELLTAAQIGGTVGAPACTTDGNRFAFVSADRRNNTHMWDVRTGDIFIPKPEEYAHAALSFSADGQRLLMERSPPAEDLEPTHIAILDLEEETLRPLAPAEVDQRRPRWREDDVVFFQASGHDTWDLMLWQPGHAPRRLGGGFRLPSQPRPYLTPDGDYALATRPRSDAITLVPLDGGLPVELHTGLLDLQDPTAVRAGDRVLLAFVAVSPSSDGFRVLHTLDITEILETATTGSPPTAPPPAAAPPGPRPPAP